MTMRLTARKSEFLEKSIENSFVAISDGKSGTELSEIPAASAVKTMRTER
ncbi:MAG: hypothetical protein L6V90_12790 [Treponema succinifaciens]|nr:MAG: hypothetical protein L6V90_12790 [Treponema succinifaciens]